MKQTLPQTISLGGAQTGTSKKFTVTEQQWVGEAAILELGGDGIGGGKLFQIILMK